MSMQERLDRLEAGHVRLMTEHGVFVREQERACQENRLVWEHHKAWLRKYDALCSRDREERKELDRRLDRLIVGIGEFIRGSALLQSQPGPPQT